MHSLKRRAGGVGVGLVACAFVGAAGWAQCYQFVQVPEAMRGTSGFGSSYGVGALRVHDLDGPGPLEPELLMGTRYGVGWISRWNGSRHLAMPGRVAATDFLLRFGDFEPHAGSLFAAGRFQSINGSNPLFGSCVVELRDGWWQPVMNVNRLRFSPGGTAFDLYSDGTRLLVAGQDMAGGQSQGNALVMSLVGSTWSIFEPRTGAASSHSLTRFNGEYFIGGSGLGAVYASIVRGQPNAFVPVYNSTNVCVSQSLSIRGYREVNGMLYAFGSTNAINGGSVGPPLLRWTGTQWVDGGYPILPEDPYAMEDIHGLVTYNGLLYAHGSACGGDRIPALARLEGETWVQIPIEGYHLIGDTLAFFDAVEYDGKLVLAMDGYPGVTFYDGSQWSYFDQPISASASDFTGVMTNGEDVFVSVQNSSALWLSRNVFTPPSEDASTPVGRLTPDGWRPFGSGPSFSPNLMLAWGERVVARTSDGGLRISDGGPWAELVTDAAPDVTAMVVWEGDLVFAQAGMIKRYDGTTITNLSPVDPPRVFNDLISALAVHQGQLLMGGSFTQASRAGESPVQYQPLLVWNGTDWQNFSVPTLSGQVRGITPFGEELLINGFSLALNGVAQSTAIRWTNGGWSSTMNAPSSASQVIAAGGSVMIRNFFALSVLDLATNTWLAPRFSPNAGASIQHMAADPQGRYLHVVGDVFRPADIGLTGYGRLSLGRPLLERQPEDFTVRQGGTAAFTLDVLSERPQMQWRRNGVNLVNGTTPHGSTIISATGPYLQINNAKPEDAGTYDCVLTATCPGTPAAIGVTLSQPAILTVQPAVCDSVDFNNDNMLYDPVDVDAFLSVFSEGPCIPVLATCNDVDFNNDGSLFDPVDVDAFLSVFSEGPCF